LLVCNTMINRIIIALSAAALSGPAAIAQAPVTNSAPEPALEEAGVSSASTRAASQGETATAAPSAADVAAGAEPVATPPDPEVDPDGVQPFQLLGQSVEPGTWRQLAWTASYHFGQLGGATPVLISHGAQEGPVLCLTGAVHGDELNGIEIIRRVVHSLDPKALSGTVIGVPIVNLAGFQRNSRYLPDRRDLNRYFPGSPTGSLASRVAYSFFTEVIEHCDRLADLHTGSFHRTNLPQVRISPSDAVTRRMAASFAAPVVLTSPLRDGSLRAVAAAKGTPVLLYEAGEGLRFDEMAVRAGVAGILRVMHAEDMLPAKGIAPSRRQSHVCSSSTWLRAPVGGLLRTFRAEGETVKQGDALATVSDPFGKTEEDIIAPHDGILIGRAILPVVNEGDAVFHLAKLLPKAVADTVEDMITQLESDPLFDEDEII